MNETEYLNTEEEDGDGESTRMIKNIMINSLESVEPSKDSSIEILKPLVVNKKVSNRQLLKQ